MNAPSKTLNPPSRTATAGKASVGFYNPVAARFGPNAFEALPEVLAGRSYALLTSQGTRRRGLTERLRRVVGYDSKVIVDDVPSHPTIAQCLLVGRKVVHEPFDLILALGGGSVIDAAKAVAAQAAEPADLEWLARHLRQGAPFPAPDRIPPIIAIPTTAGTGSEVTMWATIWDDVDGVKRSLSHPRLYPESAIVDPNLTLTLPPEQTASGALDALSHAMEAVWNRSHNAVSDLLSENAIGAIAKGLPATLADPSDLEARCLLHQASLTAGYAFSNTQTAIAHSLSYPLTGQLGIAHGIACSFTLPELLRRISARAPDRIRPILRALDSDEPTQAAERVARLLRLCSVGNRLAPVHAWRATADWDAFPLLAPGRAENTIVPIDAPQASEILDASLSEFPASPGPLLIPRPMTSASSPRPR